MPFRKKPVEVGAIQWRGDNWIETAKFHQGDHFTTTDCGLIFGSPTSSCRSTQYGDVGQVLAALRNAALIAGTVLSADQTMGRAAALGSDIEIGPRSLDLFF